MRDREQRAEEMRREAAKPFARSRDDADLDAALKGATLGHNMALAMSGLATASAPKVVASRACCAERTRFGDPMAGKVRQKPVQQEQVIPDHMLERMKKGGFVIPQVRAAVLVQAVCGDMCGLLQPEHDD